MAFKVILYEGVDSKFAVILKSEFIETVMGLSVEPFDHVLKLYPELGVAVILTCDPSLYTPPVVETVPPVPDSTLSVKLLVLSIKFAINVRF